MAKLANGEGRAWLDGKTPFLESNRHLALMNTAQDAMNYIVNELTRAPETATAAFAAAARASGARPVDLQLPAIGQTVAQTPVGQTLVGLA